MRKVILDCDNTFGLPDHDVDDGLTLFYILGAPTLDLLGVTLTYGNSSLAEVTKMTNELQTRLALPFQAYSTNQAKFLVEQVNQAPNQVTILATGALTNLYEAQKIDPLFFQKVEAIVLMGGTVEPLVVNQRAVKELNFSCDPVASEAVLLSQAKLTIMNGHMTAAAFFSKNELVELLQAAEPVLPRASFDWLATTLAEWIEWNQKVFRFSGFCNWDMTTAVYLERPDFFSEEAYYLSAVQDQLFKGQLQLTARSDYRVKMPKKLLALSEFNQLAIERMVTGLTKK